MHKKSEALYSTRRTFIDLPVIVGSGVIAFLNAGSSSLFADPQISSVALGIGSLVVGILNTMGTYFGWAKRAEGHRLSAVHYAKLFRFIAVEMSLPREERMTPHDFLRYVKDQYDRLAETSPLVPPTILHKFARKFAKKYPDVAKPEEANGLEKIRIYKPGSTDVRVNNPSGLSASGSFAMDIMSPKPDAVFSQANPMHIKRPPEPPASTDVPSAKALQEIADTGVGMPVLPTNLNES